MRTTIEGRRLPLTVRLNCEERAALHLLAMRRRVSANAVVRGLIWDAVQVPAELNGVRDENDSALHSE